MRDVNVLFKIHGCMLIITKKNLKIIFFLVLIQTLSDLLQK